MNKGFIKPILHELHHTWFNETIDSNTNEMDKLFKSSNDPKSPEKERRSFQYLV